MTRRMQKGNSLLCAFFFFFLWAVKSRGQTTQQVAQSKAPPLANYNGSLPQFLVTGFFNHELKPPNQQSIKVSKGVVFRLKEKKKKKKIPVQKKFVLEAGIHSGLTQCTLCILNSVEAIEGKLIKLTLYQKTTKKEIALSQSSLKLYVLKNAWCQV